MISWDYIEGPVAAFLLTSRGKRIWLFGDRHVLSYACATDKGLEGMRIGRLEHVIADLAPQMENQGQTLDVMVEVGPLRIEKGTVVQVSHRVDTYMESLNVFLGLCHFENSCTYPNIRFHAADARKTVDQLDRLLSVATRASSAMWNQTKYDDISLTAVSDEIVREVGSVLTHEDMEIISDFIDFFRERSCKTVRDVFDQLLEMASVNKAVADVRETPYENAMMNYLDHKIHSANPETVRLFTLDLNDVMENERNTVYFLCQTMEETDWIMEIPLLSTILSSQVENAIVMAGFVHIERIVEQLQSLGFSLEFEHVDLESQCMLWPGTDSLFPTT